MLISLAGRLVVIAVPKTGTTALDMTFGRLSDPLPKGVQKMRHMRLAHYQRAVAPKLALQIGALPDTLALVREPVDWLFSWYRYRSRPALRNPAHSTQGMDFAAFVEAVLTPEETRPALAQVGSQVAMLTRAEGGVGADLMFPFGQFDSAAAYVGHRMRSARRPNRVNVSPPSPAQALPAALRQRLETERAAEFELFARVEEGWPALEARLMAEVGGG